MRGDGRLPRHCQDLFYKDLRLNGLSSRHWAATYIPDADYSGGDTITLGVDDGHVAAPVEVVVRCMVRPVDDPAVVTVPASVVVGGLSDVLVSGITVADVDDVILNVSLSVDAGSISLPLAGGGTAVTGDAATVAAALAQVVYRAPEDAGAATITVTGNGVAASIPVAIGAPPAAVVVAPLSVTAWDATAESGALLSPAAGRLYLLSVAETGVFHLWVRGQGGQVAVTCDAAAEISIPLPEAEGWTCRDGYGRVVTFALSPGVHRLAVVGSLPSAFHLVAETPAVSDLQRVPALVGLGAVAVLDARDYDVVHESTGHAWLPGSTGIQVLPDIHHGGGSMAATDRGVSYRVNVAADGVYRFWLRGRGGADANSVWIGLDGLPPVRYVYWPAGGDWVWSTTSNLSQPFDLFVAAGQHSLDLRWREDGIAIDQIALSAIPGWSPSAVRLPSAIRQGVTYPTGPDDPDAPGAIIIEAEAMAQTLPGATGQVWTSRSDVVGASGTVMQAGPDLGLGFGDPMAVSKSPALIWYAYFPEAGDFDLWTRGAGPNYNGDSVHVALDGIPQSGYLWVKGVGGTLPLAWSNLLKGGAFTRMQVQGAGIHAISLWMGEDGVAIDRLIIQPAGAPAPTGTGPQAPALAPPPASAGG
jgi:hypothetical protein